jgi:hypothetical protein
MNEDVENCYRFYINTSSLKTELTRESQVVIVQVWEPKGSKRWLMFWSMDMVEAASP